MKLKTPSEIAKEIVKTYSENWMKGFFPKANDTAIQQFVEKQSEYIPLIVQAIAERDEQIKEACCSAIWCDEDGSTGNGGSPPPVNCEVCGKFVADKELKTIMVGDWPAALDELVGHKKCLEEPK